jgi:hypothetical protein
LTGNNCLARAFCTDQMEHKVGTAKGKNLWFALAILSACFFLFMAGGSLAAKEKKKLGPDAASQAGSSANIWYDFQKRSPYPYTLPLPEPRRSPIDKTYVKFEPTDTPIVHCRRCPDYAPEGGLWKLRLDKGIFRIYHKVTGWKSIGTFIVTKDEKLDPGSGQLLDSDSGQLVLSNDPVCPDVIGVYRWKKVEGKLILSEIDDPCSIRLRAMNVTHLPWQSCQPPNTEAATTGHWPKPQGCDAD